MLVRGKGDWLCAAPLFYPPRHYSMCNRDVSAVTRSCYNTCACSRSVHLLSVHAGMDELGAKLCCSRGRYMRSARAAFWCDRIFTSSTWQSWLQSCVHVRCKMLVLCKWLQLQLASKSRALFCTPAPGFALPCKGARSEDMLSTRYGDRQRQVRLGYNIPSASSVLIGELSSRLDMTLQSGLIVDGRADLCILCS